MDKDKLSSTQQLPILGKIETERNITIACWRCHKKSFIPFDTSAKHVRCPFCGQMYRIGIPPDYVRIACVCGKILTAHKKFAGQKGRCPGCRKIWEVLLKETKLESKETKLESKETKLKSKETKLESKETKLENKETKLESKETKLENKETKLESKGIENQEAQACGMIHFKCQCGQPHLVEGNRANTKIVCFRCHEEALVPPSIFSESHGLEESKREVEKWHLQTPYPVENWFSILGVSSQADIAEIKSACRNLQSQINRQDPQFQKIQLAKDTLTKPESRLWFEIMSPIADAWKDLAKNKLLLLHDEAIHLHTTAIETEEKRIHHKADKLWKKSIEHWLGVLQQPEFHAAILKRGEGLFSSKFKPDIANSFGKKIVEEILISISCQFRERYLAEQNFVRADFHLEILIPVFQHQLKQEPNNAYCQDLFLAHLTNKVQALASQKSWKQVLAALLEFQPFMQSHPELKDFVQQILCLASPFIKKGQIEKTLQILDINLS